MADSEERDDDSHGGDSDDEIAELRIQALLTKKVNEAEVSPSREPPPSTNYKNINKSHHNERSRSFRNPQGGNHGGNTVGRIPVVGAPNYVVDLTPSHLEGGYGSNYNTNAESGNKNFRRKGGYNPRGRNRGRGSDRYGGRGYHTNYNNTYSSAPLPAKTESSLVLPQDKYSNKPVQPDLSKSKEKMSARWRRIQGSDSESDSEDTESDSSDSSSDSSGSSSSSSGSSSGSDSESEDSSVHKRKVIKDGKKELPPPDAKSSGASAGNSLQRQHSNKGTVTKPPDVGAGHSKTGSPQKSMGSSRRSSASPPSKKYTSSQQLKQSPKHLQRRLSSSPSSHRPWLSGGRPRSPNQRQGSRSPLSRPGGRSPAPRNRTARSRSVTPLRKRPRNSRSPMPWTRERSPLPPRGRSRSPLQRRISPKRGSRSPLLKRSLSPLPRRDPKSSLPRKSSLGRRSSKSPLGRGSRSPLRRSSRSPLGRSSRSPVRRRSRSPGRNTRMVGRRSRSPGRGIGRRGSRSPYGRRGSRSPLPRRGSLSPLPRRSPVHRRSSRSPLPVKSSRSPLTRSSRSPLQGRGMGSYMPRRNSRSPIPKRSSRSPLTRRSSRSPMLSPRSRRSPLPRRNSSSVQRNKSRSPLRRSSRSPGIRRSSRSPLRRQSSRSPLRRKGSRSPFHRHGSRSPLHRQNSRSPKPGRNSKNSVPPKGSRSPISRLHSRNSIPRHSSRSPYREMAKSPIGERSRIPLEKSRGRGSRSPPLRRNSRSPLPRKSSRSPLSGRIARSPYKISKSSPQKVLRSSPSNRSARSPPLQRISKSPLPRRLSRSPRPTRSPTSRRLSKSPLPHSSRSPVPRMHRSRSPALRRISRSPLPRQLSRSPPPLRRPRNASPHHGDKSPSPKRQHRISPSARRSYSPSRRMQRFSQSPISPRSFNSRSQAYRRSQSPGIRRGPGMSVRSHSPLGRSPSPGGRRDWGASRRSRSPGVYRAGSPYLRHSRSLSPQNRIGRVTSPLRTRNPRLPNRGARGGFNRQGFDRPVDSALTNRFPQGNALAAAGRLEFPPGYNSYNLNSNQHFPDYNDLNAGPPGRPGWNQNVRRDERGQYSPPRLLEATWQGQYQQRDRAGGHIYSHLNDEFGDRGLTHNLPVHQGPGMQGPRGRGRGRPSSPKPLMYRSVSPSSRIERSPQRFLPSGKYGDLPPQGPNDRRRRFSPNRVPVRSNERSRSNSPYSTGSQLHMQGGRGRPLSPRDQIRRGPRTPPIPTNRKLSPRQSLWAEGKGNAQSSRGSPFAPERIPVAGGSSQNAERYPRRSNSPADHRDPFRARDLASHQQQYQSGRSHSPSYDRRQDEKYQSDLRDKLGRDAGAHGPHDRKKRRMPSPQKTDSRSRGNNVGGRGRGRGNRGRRPLSPSDRNRRQQNQSADTSQQHQRSPVSHQKGGSSGNWDKRDAKNSSQQGKSGSKYLHHSPERQGRNGSPWLEPVTPEKQGHAGGDRSLSPPANVDEAQKNRLGKQETKLDKGKENERRPRTENKLKEEMQSKSKRDSSKRSDSNIQEQSRRRADDGSHLSSHDSKKISLKPKEEIRAVDVKAIKEKEDREEDLDDKKRKKRKKKYKKLSREDGEEDSDDDASMKSKSSKKKKKEKKKKKDTKKKKKKHKKADSDSEEVEHPRSKSQKDGKRETGDLPDLRHTLKRKLDSGMEKGVKPDANEHEDKPRRKERGEDSKDSKSRQSEDSSRKKRHDGKPILVTVRSGEDRKVTSGKPSEKRGSNSSSSQRVSVHERLGPAKSTWEEGKSGRGSGSGGNSSRQKRGEKSKSHQGGGGGTNNNNNSSSSSSRLKLRR